MKINTSMTLETLGKYDTVKVCQSNPNDEIKCLPRNIYMYQVYRGRSLQFIFNDIYMKQYEWKNHLKRNRTQVSRNYIFPSGFGGLFIQVLIAMCLISSQTAICQVMEYSNIYNLRNITYVSTNFCEDLTTSRNFSFYPDLFCDHYHIGALFPKWSEWEIKNEFNYKMVCDNQVQNILQHDRNATFKYTSFLNMMQQYATPDDYSFQWDQQQCKYSYKLWICSYYHRVYEKNETFIEPCDDFCYKVEKSCPFFRIFNKTKLYGGQSTFLCSGIGTAATSSENCYNMTHSSLKPLSTNLKPTSCKVKKKEEKCTTCHEANVHETSGNESFFSLKSIMYNGSSSNKGGCESCLNNSNPAIFPNLYLLIAILSFLINNFRE